ncbi:MAG: metal-sulfur cluster assembly factor [Spirochaetales bacterium]|nr:metal-sulfur cluster assembly factor [Spirochaetales bacterium]
MEDSLKNRKKTEDELFKAMGDIYDPEIMAPITDLGLIYRVEVTGEHRVEVDFTLTYPGCPWGPVLDKSIKKTLKRKFDWIEEVETNMVFSPPWQIDFAKEELRVAMGYPI